MLTSSPVTTILPVIDLKRARDFYENKLGLKPVGAKPDGKFVYACGGALIALSHAARPRKPITQLSASRSRIL